jgi:hypothetical protein
LDRTAGEPTKVETPNTRALERDSVRKAPKMTSCMAL